MVNAEQAIGIVQSGLQQQHQQNDWILEQKYSQWTNHKW